VSRNAARDNRDIKNIVPQGVSARRIIRQMNLWGWTEGKTKGEHVEMYHPEKAETVWVYRVEANQHTGNEQMRQIYRLTCGGDAIQFWSRETQYVPNPDNVTPITKPRTISAKPAFRTDAPAPATTQPSPEPTIEESKNMHISNTEKTKKPSSNTGISSLVLQAMMEKPRTLFSSVDLANLFDVDRSVAANAMTHLHSLGHVVRIKRGLYRLSAEMAATRVVHHAHTGPVEHVREQPFTPEQPSPLVDVVFAIADKVDELDDRTAQPIEEAIKDSYLDELLELILPDGYQFKVKHLDAMSEWKQATAELLRTLRS
jgi:predicted RNA binding protein YcfA (HicA-like mRNA interferase family)